MQETFEPLWHQNQERNFEVVSVFDKFKKWIESKDRKSMALIWAGVGIFLLVSLTLGVFVFGRQAVLSKRLESVGDHTPYDVTFTDVSSESFSISWKTKESSIGYIRYGFSEDVVEIVALSQEDPNGRKREHVVTVRGLEPGVKYFVEVHSNAQAFGQEGKPLSISTLD